MFRYLLHHLRVTTALLAQEMYARLQCYTGCAVECKVYINICWLLLFIVCAGCVCVNCIQLCLGP